jgi:hypothetical protein
MRGQIEAKIRDWQQGLEQLQTQRAKLAQALTETDAAIQRNLGAIQAAQEMLPILPPAPEAEPAALEAQGV